MADSRIHVEVAYALPDKQKIIGLDVEPGCSARDAVLSSKITELFPEIEPETAKMGVFGKAIPKPAEYALSEGERVEIYRPLLIDPKEARRARAEKAKMAD